LIYGFDFKGHRDAISRQRRSSPDNSQQKSVHISSEVKLLIKQELRLLQNQISDKDKRSAAQDQKVTQGDEEDPEPEGDQVPRGDPGRRDLLGNMDL